MTAARMSHQGSNGSAAPQPSGTSASAHHTDNTHTGMPAAAHSPSAAASATSATTAGKGSAQSAPPSHVGPAPTNGKANGDAHASSSSSVMSPPPASHGNLTNGHTSHTTPVAPSPAAAAARPLQAAPSASGLPGGPSPRFSTGAHGRSPAAASSSSNAAFSPALQHMQGGGGASSGASSGPTAGGAGAVHRYVPPLSARAAGKRPMPREDIDLERLTAELQAETEGLVPLAEIVARLANFGYESLQNLGET